MVLGKIERLRKKLHTYIERFGLNSEQTQKVSKELDQLINEYNKQQRMFEEGNKTGETYKLSIKELKKLTIENGEFPSIERWNKYAKDNVLLNSESIKYISNLNWNELREKIFYEINKKIF